MSKQYYETVGKVQLWSDLQTARALLEEARASQRANHDRANAERMRADEAQARQLEAEKAASIAKADLETEQARVVRLRQIIATLGEVVTHSFMPVRVPNGAPAQLAGDNRVKYMAPKNPPEWAIAYGDTALNGKLP